MNLFKKYKYNAYGVSYSEYGFQAYVPEWLDYRFRVTILRTWHTLFGHRWGKWGKFSYVAKGKTGFATVSDKNKRTCNCYATQYKNWSKKEQMQLAKMHKVWGKSLQTGYIGELYQVRFIQTTNAKTA